MTTEAVVCIIAIVIVSLCAHIEVWLFRRQRDAMADAFEEADDQAAHWREQARLKDVTIRFLMDEIAKRDLSWDAEEFAIPARNGEAS